MDALELLSRYGHTEPVDDTVIAAAAAAVLLPDDRQRRRRQPQPRRSRRPYVAAIGIAAAVAGVAVAATVWPDPSATHPAATPRPHPPVVIHYILAESPTANTGPDPAPPPPVLLPAIKNGPVSRGLEAKVAPYLPAGYAVNSLSDQPIDCGTAATATFTNPVGDLIDVQSQCLDKPVDAASLARTNRYALTDLPNGNQILTTLARPKTGVGGYALVFVSKPNGTLVQLGAYAANTPGRTPPLNRQQATQIVTTLINSEKSAT